MLKELIIRILDALLISLDAERANAREKLLSEIATLQSEVAELRATALDRAENAERARQDANSHLQKIQPLPTGSAGDIRDDIGLVRPDSG